MKYIVAILSLLFAGMVMAEMPPKPERCPSADAIRAADLQHYSFVHFTGDKGKEFWTASINRNFFDTKDKWNFIIYAFEAKDSDEAFDRAKRILSSMQFVSGPFEMGDYWNCQYMDGQNNYAFAFTPPFYG